MKELNATGIGVCDAVVLNNEIQLWSRPRQTGAVNINNVLDEVSTFIQAH